MEQHHYWDSFFQSVPGKHKHLRWWRGELMFMSSPEDVFLERAATSLESAAHFERKLTAISSQPFLQAKSSVRWSCRVQTETDKMSGWLVFVSSVWCHLVGKPVEIPEQFLVCPDLGRQLWQPGLYGLAGVRLQSPATCEELCPGEPTHLLRSELPGQHWERNIYLTSSLLMILT